MAFKCQAGLLRREPAVTPSYPLERFQKLGGEAHVQLFRVKPVLSHATQRYTSARTESIGRASRCPSLRKEGDRVSGPLHARSGEGIVWPLNDKSPAQGEAQVGVPNREEAENGEGF
jgi:hypothetical protein